MSANTLFLRLAGPMQSWGTSSRLQLRRSDAVPSKSGVLGLLLCASGIRRDDSAVALKPLTQLAMGVRIDRPGTLDWDFHTVGGGHGHGDQRALGIRSADDAIKKTATTGEFETLLSRRQYLWDASFLIALRGKPRAIDSCAVALENPIWPVFLGRKCCIPAEPIFAGLGEFDSLADALQSIPWSPRFTATDGDRDPLITLEGWIEHGSDSPLPDGARLVYDVPRVLGYYDLGARWIVPAKLTAAVGATWGAPRVANEWADPYGAGWKDLVVARLAHDHQLCVFCKLPARQVYRLDHADVRLETLRSLCELCYDACTSLEFGGDMRHQRIDPSDPLQRTRLSTQIEQLLAYRHLQPRREPQHAARAGGTRG